MRNQARQRVPNIMSRVAKKASVHVSEKKSCFRSLLRLEEPAIN